MGNEKKSLSDTMKLAISIIFATLLWYYVVTDQNPLITRSYDVPIKLLNMEYIEKNDLILMQNPNSLKVSIKLKGYKDDLELVSPTNLSAASDLIGIKSGGETRTDISFSGIPNGISLMEQSPKELVLNFERKISTHLQISYKLKGKTPDGFAPVINSIDPAEVLVTGPESLITKAKSAIINVDVTGLSGDTTKELIVSIFDGNGKELTDLSVIPKTSKISLSLGLSSGCLSFRSLLANQRQGTM